MLAGAALVTTPPSNAATVYQSSSQVAETYRLARALRKDMAETVKRYRKAAEQGHAGAQYNLGEYYANGQGVSKDIAEARRWYQKPPIRGMKVPRRPCSNRLCTIYDVRCTIWKVRALCAGIWRSWGERDVMELCAGMARRGRERDA